MKTFFIKFTSLLMATILFLMCKIPLFNDQYGKIEMLDVSYGEQTRQKYDIVFPSKAKDAKKDIGLLLYVHGGGWTIGDKEWHRSRIELYSNFGFACASTNYRYTDSKTTVNEMLDDITSAIASIVKLGMENGFNINKVMLVGHSAGAHLSWMYAYTRKDTCPVEVVAVCERSGLTDLSSDSFFTTSDLGTADFVSELFSNVCGKKFTYDKIDEARSDLLKASPISYVDKDTVPTIITHGAKDTTVDVEQAKLLDKKLNENKVKHHLIIFPNSGHGLADDDLYTRYEETVFILYMIEYLVQ